MDDKKMLFARVDQEFGDEVQRLADEHYDGNMSMLVRQAVKRFLPFLRALPIEPVDPETELVATP